MFNADRSQNIGGKLTHIAQLKINIEGHEEIMDLGVSNLGKSDIFLGHNWLRHHNPDIDWRRKIIQFNRCPGSCYQEEIGEDPEQEIEPGLEEGERLLAIHTVTLKTVPMIGHPEEIDQPHHGKMLQNW